MSDITEEDVMKYCNSRNLMLVTKESLEYMHRPIVIETMNKNAIPIEWLHSIMERQIIFAMESEMEGTTTVKDGFIHCVSGALACQVLVNVIKLWEEENAINRP